jgi:hypothetical protein
MAICSPFHSAKSGVRVYHNNTLCTEGNNIERFYRRAGAGVGRVLCTHCARLAYSPFSR